MSIQGLQDSPWVPILYLCLKASGKSRPNLLKPRTQFPILGSCRHSSSKPLSSSHLGLGSRLLDICKPLSHPDSTFRRLKSPLQHLELFMGGSATDNRWNARKRGGGVSFLCGGEGITYKTEPTGHSQMAREVAEMASDLEGTFPVFPLCPRVMGQSQMREVSFQFQCHHLEKSVQPCWLCSCP